MKNSAPSFGGAVLLWVPHSGNIMGHKKKTDGTNGIKGEKKQKRKSEIRWNVGDQHINYRLEKADRCHNQRAPGKGKGQADSSVKISGGEAVVPEKDTQEALAGPVIEKLYGCSSYPANEKKRPSSKGGLSQFGSSSGSSRRKIAKIGEDNYGRTDTINQKNK